MKSNLLPTDQILMVNYDQFFETEKNNDFVACVRLSIILLKINGVKFKTYDFRSDDICGMVNSKER